MNERCGHIKKAWDILVFLLFLAVYGLSAGSKIVEQSETPQYVHLANSFLHGHLDLFSLPESKFDLLAHNGRWYVPGGMTPALLLMPFVSVFGTGVGDVLFGVILGAAIARSSAIELHVRSRKSRSHLQ